VPGGTQPTPGNDGPNPVRVVRGQPESQRAAHRVSDHVGLLDLERVEQAYHVLDELETVFLRVMRLVAAPVASLVQRDHPVCLRQRVQKAREAPIHLGAEREAVEEDHSVALTRIEIPDAYAVRVEEPLCRVRLLPDQPVRDAEHGEHRHRDPQALRRLPISPQER